ncbi:hypothetical protein I3843_02G092400 [Carya illinoinensis]|nr:hypothetical protein I3843_02G092400 [Carya illinoinensis]
MKVVAEKVVDSNCGSIPNSCYANFENGACFSRYKDYSSSYKKRWNYMLSWKKLLRRML